MREETHHNLLAVNLQTYSYSPKESQVSKCPWAHVYEYVPWSQSTLGCLKQANARSGMSPTFTKKQSSHFLTVKFRCMPSRLCYPLALTIQPAIAEHTDSSDGLFTSKLMSTLFPLRLLYGDRLQP